MQVDLSIDELLEEFSLFEDWNEKYQYLIELGDQLGSDFPDEERIDDNLVQGCQSRVWLITQVGTGEPATVEVLADSDSQIVRGLIVILLVLLSGKSPKEIEQCDVEGVFEQLELIRHLSRSRANGLYSMVKRIRALAAAVS